MSGSLRRFYRRYPWLRARIRWFRQRGLEWMAKSVLAALGRLSLPRALWLGERLGLVAHRLMGSSRRLALEHLELAFGSSISPQARERLARASFVNLGRSFCELAKIDEIRGIADTYVEVEGWEKFERIRAAGTGCIAITGHIGNWELLAASFAWRGVPVAAVARRIYAPGLNDLLVQFRARQGVETILRESPSSARQILRTLRENGVLAMLIDQDTKVASVSVPFFGRLARTPLAAASLALRRDLPIVPIFVQRRGDWGCRIVVREPIHPQPTGDNVADVRQLTATLNRVIEDQIRANPAEWVWWHRRWRRSPVPRLDLDAEPVKSLGAAIDQRPG